MRISSSEAQLMEVLWQRSPVTSEEILSEVASPNDWSESTVRTLLNRLLNKGAVEAVRQGRQYLYRPKIERAAYVQSESQGLLDRLFQGELSPLITHFAQHRDLSPQELGTLKALIADVEKKHG